MRMRHGVSLTVCLLALSGCGDDANGNVPDGDGITGTWEFGVDVTQAMGDCVGEEGDGVAFATVGIVEFESGDVQATSRWFSDGGSHVFTGTRTGDSVTFSGSYTEEGGLLQATYDLTVNADETQMTGTESWTWARGAENCPNGLSTVVADRN